MSYLYISSHEFGHQHAFSSQDSSGHNVSNLDSNGVVQNTYYPIWDDNLVHAPGDHTNQEFDSLNPDWKAAHHLNSQSSDTTQAYRGGIHNYSPSNPATDKPDTELVADIEALGLMFKNSTLWMQDWSNQGIQYFNNVLPSSFLSTIPGITPPQYELGFQFTPKGGVVSTNVSTIDELQSLVDPTGNLAVLKSLEDLGP